jgi:hypothetical protein
LHLKSPKLTRNLLRSTQVLHEVAFSIAETTEIEARNNQSML